MSQMNSIFNSFNFCLLQERLETFKKWPFSSNAPCSALKMAEAGFYQPNPLVEQDLAKCFICMKELDGWEENDDPWKEHEKHQNACDFVKNNKPESQQLLEDILDLLQASVLKSMQKIQSEQQEKLKDDFRGSKKALEKKWKRKK